MGSACPFRPRHNLGSAGMEKSSAVTGRRRPWAETQTGLPDEKFRGCCWGVPTEFDGLDIGSMAGAALEDLPQPIRGRCAPVIHLRASLVLEPDCSGYDAARWLSWVSGGCQSASGGLPGLVLSGTPRPRAWPRAAVRPIFRSIVGRWATLPEGLPAGNGGNALPVSFHCPGAAEPAKSTLIVRPRRGTSQ